MQKRCFYCLLPHKTLYIYFYFNNKKIFIDKHTVQCSFEYELSGSERIRCGPGEYNRLGLARVTLRSRALAGGALNSLKAQVCDQGQGPSLPAHRCVCCDQTLYSVSDSGPPDPRLSVKLRVAETHLRRDLNIEEPRTPAMRPRLTSN